jgi:hypothetical protein
MTTSIGLPFSSNLPTTFNPVGDSGASAQAARIVHSRHADQTSNMEPQTVQAAQEYLRNLPGFGPGVLQRKDGTGLAPGSQLQPGQEYVFVSSAAAVGESIRPYFDCEAQSLFQHLL